MGPKPNPGQPPAGIVFARGLGANVFDSDGNRYVDLAAGFGALLLGHSHPEIVKTVQRQSEQLMQALGDLYPSEVKIELLERLTALYPGDARALLGQSGSDAVSAALKLAVLHTGRSGVIALSGAYHGLGYGPLSLLGLRASYREPFTAQLNPRVRFIDYPADQPALESALARLDSELSRGDIGAIVVEPILGRGGAIVPPKGFLSAVAERARTSGALFVADEVWTGLGRSGRMLQSTTEVVPDLICLGKGLGGGLPISALIGRAEIMRSWSRDAEVVHTSTFAGAPLSCAAALATLSVLQTEALDERAKTLGEEFLRALQGALAGAPLSALVRGQGLMIGVEVMDSSGVSPSAIGFNLQRALLERGYITSTGGGQREVLVLTPPLNISKAQLFGFIPQLLSCLKEAAQ